MSFVAESLTERNPAGDDVAVCKPENLFPFGASGKAAVLNNALSAGGALRPPPDSPETLRPIFMPVKTRENFESRWRNSAVFAEAACSGFRLGEGSRHERARLVLTF